jgi:hypothetical protein
MIGKKYEVPDNPPERVWGIAQVLAVYLQVMVQKKLLKLMTEI